jgi:phage baseplate assembly protein W
MAIVSGNRRVYSFKSVGESLEDYNKNSAVDTTVLPIGLVTPLRFGDDSSGIFQMHFTLKSQVADNLRNLVQTNWGERLGLYDFGGNLEELAFELGTDAADSEAMRRIKKTVAKYMPFIDLTAFEPYTDKTGDTEHVAKIGFRIAYNVPSINVMNQGIDVIIYTAG